LFIINGDVSLISSNNITINSHVEEGIELNLLKSQVHRISNLIPGTLYMAEFVCDGDDQPFPSEFLVKPKPAKFLGCQYDHDNMTITCQYELPRVGQYERPVVQLRPHLNPEPKIEINGSTITIKPVITGQIYNITVRMSAGRSDLDNNFSDIAFYAISTITSCLGQASNSPCSSEGNNNNRGLVLPVAEKVTDKRPSMDWRHMKYELMALKISLFIIITLIILQIIIKLFNSYDNRRARYHGIIKMV